MRESWGLRAAAGAGLVACLAPLASPGLGTLVTAGTAVVAAVACLLAARRGDDASTAWRAFTGAALCWAVVRAGVAVGAPGVLPASLLEVGRLAAVVLAARALLALPTAPGVNCSRLAALVDGLLVALPLLFLASAVGTPPVVHQSRHLVADIALLAVAVVAAGRTALPLRPVVALLGAGATALVVADTAVMLGAPVVGSMGWTASATLLTVAALPRREATMRLDRRAGEDPVALLLPDAPLLLALPVWVQRSLGGTAPLAVWGALVFSVLVVARQLLGGLAHLALRARFASTVVELRDHAERSAFLAHHDALTGLPNRTLFADRLRQALAGAARSGTSVAVLLVDLDRFKEINDTLGHHMGDALLRLVGPRVLAELREIDTIARLGGDEFVVLLPEVADEAAAMVIAERLLAALQRPFRADNLNLTVEASIGVALSPEHASDEASLLQRADVALYVAKELRGTAQVYDPAHDEHDVSRLTLVGELRRALYAQQLVVHYQPLAELATGRVVGVEALVHWPHPTRGVLPPDQFIPAAEQTGLIQPLTLFVLERALREASAWRKAGHPLSVDGNLSARTLLNLRLPDEVAALLAKWQVPADALDLEITETTMMVDPGRALQVLDRLSALGVGIAVDDYGTGYSSLAYLSRLPINALKIDRSFVGSMRTDEGNATIVRSTIDLAHNLGLRVVAEGVETAETWQALADLGCDLAQGYHLSRPIPPEQVPGLLTSQSLATASA